MRLEFFIAAASLVGLAFAQANAGAAAIASLAAELTVPITLTPSQTTALANAWASQLSSWAQGSEFSSLANILATAIPSTLDSSQVLSGTESWLTALPTAVQQGLEKEQSALLSVESKVLAGAGSRETGIVAAGAAVAVGVVGVMVGL